jgi:hypothetical protein
MTVRINACNARDRSDSTHCSGLFHRGLQTLGNDTERLIGFENLALEDRSKVLDLSFDPFEEPCPTTDDGELCKSPLRQV